MFASADSPRCFALPLGCDFSLALVAGLKDRLKGQPPEAIARVEIFVNTQRTARRLREIFIEDGPGFLPRIRVITDLAHDLDEVEAIPASVSPLRIKLELSQVIAALLEKQPDLAPRSVVFDLAESLAALMDEMHGEGIAPEVLKNLDVSEIYAAHWQQNLTFLNLLTDYFSDQAEPGTEARQRMVITALGKKWAESPPKHPIIVAGSTGSRGATALFMRNVAQLPQGAVILPGYDFDMPDHVVETLQKLEPGGDHPQAGLVKFVTSLGLSPAAMKPWTEIDPVNPLRNKLVSLALRPAPVTDQWLSEGPALEGLDTATSEMSLVIAPNSRIESLTIALRLRKAVEQGIKATLITPDRQLTRQVTAALKRWNIVPDDSAGRPLALTPPGVFLRLVAELSIERLTTESLLILLKHPLTNSTTVDEKSLRNEHLLRTRDLELDVLRGGSPHPDFEEISQWADERKTDEGSVAWAKWLRVCFEGDASHIPSSLLGHLSNHRGIAEALAAGPDATGSSGELWLKEAGEEAAGVFTELEENADAAGLLSAPEYVALFRNVISKPEVREIFTPHPNITIWGTLEARVQGADLVILGGLNDGIWPKLPEPDPWLSRPMREAAGLLLPERRIGLSAHDFQQAIAAPEVMLTRSARDADAPTIASRWLIRLTNLLSGIGEDGCAALSDMETRGQHWLGLVAKLEQPEITVDQAKRPSPRPPLGARPAKLSVTQIKTLIRDPYAIYARNILRLRKLDPIRRHPDALLRGQTLHRALELFVKSMLENLPDDAANHLLGIAGQVLAKDAPWPATRRLWLARLARVAEWFAEGEKFRQARATPVGFETSGAIKMDEPNFTLIGKADRIDRTPEGGLIIYDYKTGRIPSKAQVEHFDKQLPLEAAMAQMGGFEGIDPTDVSGLEYIGLGGGGEVRALEISDDQIDAAWAGLRNLIRAYQQPQTGYTARARMEERAEKSDYDHLSRLGEWQDSDQAESEEVS